jgi:hypothetical protein
MNSHTHIYSCTRRPILTYTHALIGSYTLIKAAAMLELVLPFEKQLQVGSK